MYKLNNDYVKVSSYDFYLAFEYLDNNDIAYSNETYNNYVGQLEKKGFITEKKDSFISYYTIEAYKSQLNLQMIQNSILWSIINIENQKKFELEFLYKKIMAIKSQNIDSFDEKMENQLLLKFLKDDEELYEYIILTQNFDDYIHDNSCRNKVKYLLKSYK